MTLHLIDYSILLIYAGFVAGIGFARKPAFAGLYKKDAPPDWQGYWVGVAYAPTVAGPYQKDPRGKIFLGGHAAIFTGPDGGKWISYRNEERGHPARSLLSVEPFRLDASGKVCPITPTTGNTTVRRCLLRDLRPGNRDGCGAQAGVLP